MRLVDVFSTRTACALLDYLLSHPDKTFLQSWLDVDPRAVQRAARRLAALGLITVDTSFSVGKVIALNVDTEAVKALRAFYRSIRDDRQRRRDERRRTNRYRSQIPTRRHHPWRRTMLRTLSS